MWFFPVKLGMTRVKTLNPFKIQTQDLPNVRLIDITEPSIFLFRKMHKIQMPAGA
jgi:hypothetical protein